MNEKRVSRRGWENLQNGLCLSDCRSFHCVKFDDSRHQETVSLPFCASHNTSNTATHLPEIMEDGVLIELLEEEACLVFRLFILPRIFCLPYKCINALSLFPLDGYMKDYCSRSVLSLSVFLSSPPFFTLRAPLPPSLLSIFSSSHRIKERRRGTNFEWGTRWPLELCSVFPSFISPSSPWKNKRRYASCKCNNKEKKKPITKTKTEVSVIVFPRRPLIIIFGTFSFFSSDKGITDSQVRNDKAFPIEFSLSLSLVWNKLSHALTAGRTKFSLLCFTDITHTPYAFLLPILISEREREQKTPASTSHTQDSRLSLLRNRFSLLLSAYLPVVVGLLWVAFSLPVHAHIFMHIH